MPIIGESIHLGYILNSGDDPVTYTWTVPLGLSNISAKISIAQVDIYDTDARVQAGITNVKWLAGHFHINTPYPLPPRTNPPCTVAIFQNAAEEIKFSAYVIEAFAHIVLTIHYFG